MRRNILFTSIVFCLSLASAGAYALTNFTNADGARQLTDMLRTAAGQLDDKLFYNIGVLYYGAGDKGRAAIYLKRAYLLNPYDKMNRDALFLARSDLEIPEEFYQSSPLAKIFLFPFTTLTVNATAVFGLVLFVLGAAWFSILLSGLAAKLSLGDKLRTALFVTAIVFASLGVMEMTAAGVRYHNLFDKSQAVVLNDTALYKEPRADADKLADLQAGLECRVRDYEGGYYLVETVDTRKGWVSENDVEMLWEN